MSSSRGQPKKRGRFAMIPLAWTADERLSARDWRVLIAIAAHADHDGVAFPKREVLAHLTGLRETRISSATTRLVALGYLEKQNDKGGRGKRVSYVLKTLPESGTVSREKTVRVPGTVFGAETVPGSVRKQYPKRGNPLHR